MSAILSTYIPLLLLFTISFSSKSQKHDIQTLFLENEIVQFIPQPNPVKLNDRLIYPSNDKFKNCILPFLSSEKLLKIYFHFQNLYPNVSIEKFLPDSRFRFQTTVIHLQEPYFVDLQKSYFAYIFKDEFSFFNPIIFENEFDFRTVTLGYIDNNTKENSFYVLSASNKLFPFEHYILPQNREVFVSFDDNLYVVDGHVNDFGYFFAAEKKAQGKFTVIAYGIIPDMHQEVEFSDYLDSILEAHHLNCFKKHFYFKIWDLYKKYREYITTTRWWDYRQYIRQGVCPWTSFPARILYEIFRLIPLYITHFPIYYALMLFFYILSFPFECFIFQSNFVISWVITKNYVWFWTLPCFFKFIHYASYFQLYSVFYSDEFIFRDSQIKPEELKWAVPYVRVKKKLGSNTFCKVLRKLVTFLIELLLIFGFGFIYTIPFSPLMMIHGESNQ